MRPATGGNAPEAQARKQTGSDLEVTPPPPHNAGPTTFLIASEKDLDSRESATSSTYGVKSLEEDAAGSANEKDDEGEGKQQQPALMGGPGTAAEKIGQDRVGGSAGSSPAERSRRPFQLDSVSQPLTPISFASPAMGSSELNSPKSMSPRRLDNDDSGNEDEIDAPQFIMPSIIMPSRRPFTARGKDLGKLKILLAGCSGSGKTTLIKSIVQICEDIVHVDSLSPSTVSLKDESKTKRSPKSRQHTNKVVEMYASTRAYPECWAELEDTSFLRRRRSIGDSVLERNLCFVDTPGYDSRTSTLEGMEQTLRYMEGQMLKSLSLDSLEDSELLGVLTGNGGFHVDVVFYLIVHDIKPPDIEFIKRLSHLTNVVPLLSKADGSSEDEQEILKAAVQDHLTTAGIKTFNFPLNESGVRPPFTVCSSLSQDLEDMDASLLMQPDYIQPLRPSDLQQLLGLVLDKENASCLKHNAAKKLLAWRQNPRTASLPSPLSTNLNSQMAVPNPMTTALQSSSIMDLTIRGPTALTYANARLADYTQREERLAHLRLASWAGSLQRSLKNERARYEALARGERLTWLRARLDECTADGAVVSTVKKEHQRTASQSSSGSARSDNKSATPSFHSQMIPTTLRLDPADPLGLLRWGNDVRQHGIRVLQIAGGVGLLGAVAIWVVRGWTGTNGSGSWTWTWWGWAEGEGWGFLGRWIGEIAGTRKVSSDQWLWNEELGKYVFK